MDHGGMDHGGMDHGGMGHGGMGSACKMNMVWNWDLDGICLVFPSLHVHGGGGMIFYCVLMFGLSIAFESLRLRLAASSRPAYARPSLTSGRRTATVDGAGRRPTSPTDSLGGVGGSGDEDPLLGLGMGGRGRRAGFVYPWDVQVKRSGLYVANIALSFFIMLVIMTYNAYLIFSILAGAFVGHFLLHRTVEAGGAEDKSMACH